VIRTHALFGRAPQAGHLIVRGSFMRGLYARPHHWEALPRDSPRAMEAAPLQVRCMFAGSLQVDASIPQLSY